MAFDCLSCNAIPFFDSAEARDVKYAAWVESGGALTAGMLCGVTGTGLFRYDAEATAWVPDWRLHRAD